MSSQNRELVSKDLSFEKGTAGRMMNPDVVVVRPSHTIEVIRRYLRIRDELPQDMDKVFVVNRNNILRGNLPLTKILSAKNLEKAEDLMVRKFDSLLATSSEKEVDRLFERNHLISAPVTNEDGELLGRITIDDVIDSIKEEVDQPFRQISGLSRDTFQNTFLALRSRGLWLGANLITALLASSVINLFQETIEKVIFLAVLMPIIASMGGVAATQTLAITVRGLALGQIVAGNIRWILSRELIVSFWNGLFWSIILGLIASLWFKDFDIFLIVIFSMTINLIAAALSGISIPFLLRKLKFDPAIGGGVIVTTVTDIVGFFTFLGIASIVYT
jgi:magnesium transporter